MARKSRRSFSRKTGIRRYKKMFVISMEGRVTEKQYFAFFKAPNAIIHLELLPGKTKSSPQQVLKRMQNFLKQNHLNSNDEAWLVIDKDEWQPKQLQPLVNWANSNESYGLALSNPKFEYWLLLHFEDISGLTISMQERKLSNHIPNYNKNLDMRNFSNKMISAAIQRAKRKDTPPVKDWPKTNGTTVYRLVQKLLES